MFVIMHEKLHETHIWGPNITALLRMDVKLTMERLLAPFDHASLESVDNNLSTGHILSILQRRLFIYF